MDTPQTIFGYDEHTDQPSDNQSPQTHSQANTLILKSKQTTLTISKEYLIVTHDGIEEIIGRKYIKKIYIHKDISLSIAQLYELSREHKIALIDARGNTLAKLKRVSYA